MATTANDLISGALREITTLTPGEAVDGTEAAEALAILNRMLKSWSAKRYMIPCRTLESFSLPASVGSRSIGATGNFATVRPDKVTGSYLRDAGINDYPLTVLMTSAEYNAIGQKDVTGRPRRIYFDPQFPNAILYFDYVTDQDYTLFLETLKPVNVFTTLQTAITLPGEYEEAIVYLLAHRLAPGYGATIGPELAILIKDAQAFIRRKNYPLTKANFDAALLKPQPIDINRG